MVREMADRSGEMEAFAAVVQAGSLSAAGRSLRLTPSALSRLLTRIEARLGVRLLIRTTRRLSLTPAGESYHRAALRILADLAEAEGAIADQGAPRGRLRISASLAHGRLVIIPLLAHFTALYPDIMVDISLGDESVDILGGRADVAIRFGPLADSPLTARRLGANGRTIIASRAYLDKTGWPKVPRDLHAHNCLNFNFARADPGWPFVEDGQYFNLPVTGSVEANSGEALVQLVQQNVGIARVGTFHVAGEIAAGRLVALLEPYNPGDSEAIHALFVGGSLMPTRVRVFVDFLVERLAGVKD